jgi:hypothetical protein
MRFKNTHNKYKQSETLTLERLEELNKILDKTDPFLPMEIAVSKNTFNKIKDQTHELFASFPRLLSPSSCTMYITDKVDDNHIVKINIKNEV